MKNLRRERALAHQALVPSTGSWCWLESIILAFGFPAVIWVISKLITLFVPAALHSSREQRFLQYISGGLIAECLFVASLCLGSGERDPPGNTCGGNGQPGQSNQSRSAPYGLNSGEPGGRDGPHPEIRLFAFAGRLLFKKWHLIYAVCVKICK